MANDLIYDSHVSRPFGLDEIAALTRYRDLLKNLVSRDLKVRYRRSILGFLWTLLNPLLMMVVMTVIFASVFRFAIENYIAYFLPAYLIWNFFAQASAAALTSIVDNANLIKQIYAPRAIFVLSAVISGLINLLLALIPLAIILLVTGQKPGWTWLFVVVPIALTFIFAMGVSFLLSALAVFFWDVVETYKVLLLAWMYLTPIFYPVEIVPAEYRFFLYLNPMYYLIESFRFPLHIGHLPAGDMVLTGALAAFVALLIGWIVFSRASHRFVYNL